MKRPVLAAFCALTFLSAAALAVDMEERWVYVSTNLLLERNVETLVGLISEAREAGATHIQLSDYQKRRRPSEATV